MDFQEKIERLHECIIKRGYNSTLKLRANLIHNDSLYFDNLFGAIGLDEKLPQIVPDDEFYACKGETVFSGNSDIGNYIERYQKGHFKTYDEHKNGTVMGLGYYFTDLHDTAAIFTGDKYCSTGGVMITKVLDENFATHKDLSKHNMPDYDDLSISPTDSFEKQRQIILNTLQGDHRAKALLAHVLGYAGIKKFMDADSENWGETHYVVADRSATVQPQKPIAELFI